MSIALVSSVAVTNKGEGLRVQRQNFEGISQNYLTVMLRWHQEIKECVCSWIYHSHTFLSLQAEYLIQYLEDRFFMTVNFLTYCSNSSTHCSIFSYVPGWVIFNIPLLLLGQNLNCKVARIVAYFCDLDIAIRKYVERVQTISWWRFYLFAQWYKLRPFSVSFFSWNQLIFLSQLIGAIPYPNARIEKIKVPKVLQIEPQNSYRKIQGIRSHLSGYPNLVGSICVKSRYHRRSTKTKTISSVEKGGNCVIYIHRMRHIWVHFTWSRIQKPIREKQFFQEKEDDDWLGPKPE